VPRRYAGLGGGAAQPAEPALYEGEGRVSRSKGFVVFVVEVQDFLADGRLCLGK
jgi:hypothetical protein